MQQPTSPFKLGDWDIESPFPGSPSTKIAAAKRGDQQGICTMPTEGSEDRIRNEIEILKKVGDHPYIVDMFDHGETPDGTPYWIGERFPYGNVENMPFEDWAIEDYGDKARKDIKKIANAIGYCHSQGIVVNCLWRYSIMFRADKTPVLRKFAYAQQWSDRFPDTSIDITHFCKFAIEWEGTQRLARKQHQRNEITAPKLPKQLGG